MRFVNGTSRSLAGVAVVLFLAGGGCSDEAPGSRGGVSGVDGVAGASGAGAGAAGAVGGNGVVSGSTGGMDINVGGSGAVSGAGAGAGMDGVDVLPIGECATTDVKEGMCKEQAEGVYAIKTVIDVWWVDDTSPPLVDPGRDTITVFLMGELSDVCEDATGGVGKMKGCGTLLPVFKSDANCDGFAIEFPDAMWDEPTMPTFNTSGNATGFEPGDVLTLGLTTGLVGIDLDDPNIEWPSAMEAGNISCPAGTGAECFPDHDNDGKPGITIRMGRIGEELTPDGCGGFNLPFVIRGAPLDTLGALDDNGVKAAFMQIGLRTRIGGGGAIGADCTTGTGESQAEYLDSRVVGCVTSDGADCLPAQSAFVDESAPFYNILKKGEAPSMTDPRTGVMVEVPATQGGGPLDQTPSEGALSSLVRLGDLGGAFSCADVRNAAFPAF